MKLVKYLENIPLSKLVEFIGNDIVEGLQKYDIANSPHELSQILRDLKGNTIFRTPGLLKTLLWHFSSHDLSTIRSYLNDSANDLEELRLSLLNRTWGDNAFSNSVLKFFEINDSSYQKVQFQDIVDNETVVPRLSTQVKSYGNYNIFIPETYPLHPYQKATKDNIVDYLLGKKMRFILHMPTGAGKTKTAVEALIDFWRVRGKRQGFIVWFAHSKELCEQAYITFKDTWAAKGDYPIQLFKVFDQNTPDLSSVENGVLFVGFQKFYGLIKQNHHTALRVKNNTRLVVVDEAHKAVADTFEKSINYLISPNTKLMGLTATPGRSSDINDPENAQLATLFHNNIITICGEDGNELNDSIKYLQDHGYLARLKRIKIETDIQILASNTTSSFPKDLLAKIANNDVRNSKIIGEIEKAVKDRQHPTLVFSTSTSHAIILKILLAKIDIQSECVLSGTPAEFRSSYINSFKSGNLPVLINYGVLTTGFDAPNIRTLVICRPTTSIVLYSQMLGRALRGRKMGGVADENILVDIVDNYCAFGTERATFNFFDDYYTDE